MVSVKPFRMDKMPVTNEEYYAFVQSKSKWQKQNIAKLFVEPDY